MYAHIQGLVTKIFSFKEFMLNFIHGNGRDHRSKQITAAMGQALAVFRCRQAYISLAFTCAATAWISPQRVWIDYISLSSYLVRSKIWKSVPTISAKQHQPSEDQLISMVLVFVNSLTTVITVFAFYNTQLSFFSYKLYISPLHRYLTTRLLSVASVTK